MKAFLPPEEPSDFEILLRKSSPPQNAVNLSPPSRWRSSPSTQASRSLKFENPLTPALQAGSLPSEPLDPNFC